MTLERLSSSPSCILNKHYNLPYIFFIPSIQPDKKIYLYELVCMLGA